jgi:hypothetical protein
MEYKLVSALERFVGTIEDQAVSSGIARDGHIPSGIPIGLTWGKPTCRHAGRWGESRWKGRSPRQNSRRDRSKFGKGCAVLAWPSDTHPGSRRMKQPSELTHEELVGVVEQIQQFLYEEINEEGRMVWNPDKEWDAETLEYVAAVLVDAGLSPVDGAGHTSHGVKP